MALLSAALIGVVVIALVAGAVARGLGTRADEQRAADLAALSGAKALRAAYPRLFEPPLVAGRLNPAHLERGAYLALGERAAEEAAHSNGARRVAVSFPAADPLAPTRIRVEVADPIEVKGQGRVSVRVLADAELAPPASSLPPDAGEGEFRGPFGRRTTGQWALQTARSGRARGAARVPTGVSLRYADVDTR